MSVFLETGGALAYVEAHFERSIGAAGRFFEQHAGAVAEVCRLMAGRFEAGGSLYVLGEGAQASDAHHAAVEFVHPVLVGKRALTAVALGSDAAFVAALADPGDIALAICAGVPSTAIDRAMGAARERGLLTVVLSGGAGRASGGACFAVAEDDPCVVQEVHETLYHVLWELVHLFLGDEDELQGYLAPAGRSDEDRLVQARESTRQKCRDVCALRAEVRVSSASGIAEASRAIASRLARGGRLLAFGNGGSATDAEDAAIDCMAPPTAGWRAVPALALTADAGIITAVGNDVGFDHVFARQVAAYGRPADVALGFSTSGTSRSVLNGLREAGARGLLTVALAGYDGGAMAAPGAVDYCFVAPSDYVPRIQEAHATIWHALLGAAQSELRLTPPGSRP